MHKSGGDVCTVYKAVNRAVLDFVIVENIAVFRKIFNEQFVAFLLLVLRLSHNFGYVGIVFFLDKQTDNVQLL